MSHTRISVSRLLSKGIEFEPIKSCLLSWNLIKGIEVPKRILTSNCCLGIIIEELSLIWKTSTNSD